MRSLFAVLALSLGSYTLLAAADGDTKVELKGPHICCKQCINVAKGILKKVDGVSDAEAEAKLVTFTAKDEKAAKAGLKALVDAGFFGTATIGTKEAKLDSGAIAAKKADKISIVGVHDCCGQCSGAINKVVKGIAKDAKISREGKGPQKTIIIEGSDIDGAAILTELRKSGFNGKIE